MRNRSSLLVVTVLFAVGFAWVYGLAAPLAGAIVDRTSRRKVILAGLQAWSAICMATALSLWP